MMYMRRNSKIMIVILVFVVYFAFGVKKSKILSSFGNPYRSGITELVMDRFDALKNTQKIIVSINSAEYINDIDKTEKLLKVNQAKEILSERNTGTYVSLVEIERSKSEEVLSTLRASEYYVSDKMITQDLGVKLNIDERVSNLELSKKQVKKLLANTSMPDRLDQLSNQLNKIQTSLDSLETVKDVNSSLIDNNIILIEIVKQSQNNSLSSSIISLVKTTFITIIVLSIVLTLLFLIMLFLLWLMKKLGIKTSRSGSGYYGNYDYNPRRVKRVYKDKSKGSNDKE